MSLTIPAMNIKSALKTGEAIASHPKTVSILLVLGLCLLVGQHWGMMLSNSDDPWITRSTFQEVLDTASAQGRFWLVPINLLAGLPYQSGNWIVANSTKMLVNGAVFVLFVVFCCRLLGRVPGLLVGLVWLALIDVSPGYYSPFHGFLLMFNLQFAALFAGLIWYLHILDSNRPDRVVIGPYLLFGFSLLAYEPMLFYAGTFPVVFLSRMSSPWPASLDVRGWSVLLFQFMKKNWMLPLVVAAYIAAYVIYRKFQSTPGRGLDVGGNPLDIAITVYRFSINGFHFQPKALTNFIPGASADYNLWLSVAFATCIAFGALFLLPRPELEESGARLARPLPLLIIAFFVLCPNLLHGFVESYRQWAAEDPHYVGNYFSSFPLAMLISIGLMQLTGGSKAMQEKALYAIVVALLSTSACDNYVRWSNLAEINRRDARLWSDALADLRGSALLKTQKSLICGINAPEKVSGDDRYWSGILTDTLETKVEYRSKALDRLNCTIKVDFNQYRFKSPRV